MRYLDAEAVRQACSVEQAIPLMAQVMAAFSTGRVIQPVRTVLRHPDDGSLFGSMPCHLDGAGFGLKAIMLKPDNVARGLPAHVGVVVVFDPATGLPEAILDGAEATAIRTAAVSGAATDVLARPDAGDLAVLGAGVQARYHLLAMAAVRPLRRVRIWSRTEAGAQRLAAWAADRLGVPAQAVASAAAATAGADLVCTTTSAHDPVLHGGDLAAGVHVNAVGASIPQDRELSSDAVARCTVFVDSRASAAQESGDLLVPLAEGAIGPDHVRGEIGEVIAGSLPGRRGDEELTLYVSLGLAAQDVGFGFAASRNAAQLGLGVEVGVDRVPAH